jgi:Uma2 family endonuclease
MPYLSVANYLRGAETMRRRELEFGILRDGPSPMWSHQETLLRLGSLLDAHVRAGALGKVCIAPIDVVLDREKALIVQPDLVFVSTARLAIIDRRIWGAPDLAVEIMSPGSYRRDRSLKRRWYRQYGVREYWIVDPLAARIDLIDFEQPRSRRNQFTGAMPIVSRVLPGLSLTASMIVSD